MRTQMTIATILAATFSFVAVSTASASYLLVEDFNSLTGGGAQLNGQNGWFSDSPSVVVADPAGGPNQVASIRGDASKNFAPTIANNTTGTVFMRVRFDDLSMANTSFGASDINFVANSNSFGDYESQIAAASGTVSARNGGDFDGFDQTGSFADDVWYSFWLVTNNTANETTAYVQGGAFASQTQLTINLGDSTFGFRNGTSGPLQSIIFRSGRGSNAAVFFDDIYVDNAAQNLSDPLVVVPEPSALVLLVLGIVGVCASCRRRTR